MNKFFLLLAALLAACTIFEPTPAPPMSAWGVIFTLGQAEQADAPSFWPFADRVVATWIGADETGIHQDGRNLTQGRLSGRVVLPLPPKSPYAQQLMPAGDNNSQLLWLDADPAANVHLYSAIISPMLTVERGPTLITEEPTRRYSVILNGDGSLWAISSGGLLIEPRLYKNFIDPQGRPHLDDKASIAIDADWPTAAQTNDLITTLFWIRPSDNMVMRSAFAEGQLQDPQPIMESIDLNRGDRLVSFDASLDASVTYLFWNISRANGQNETWFASGTSDALNWAAPQRLGFDITTGNFESGFNSGIVSAARTGSRVVAWTATLPGQNNPLPVAAVNDGRLGILYLQQGAVVGYQDITPVGAMIGLPAVRTDRDRFLYLAWSEPNLTAGKADLKLTTTRRYE